MIESGTKFGDLMVLGPSLNKPNYYDVICLKLGRKGQIRGSSLINGESTSGKRLPIKERQDCHSIEEYIRQFNWNLRKTGYLYCDHNKVKMMQHRFIWITEYGNIPDNYVVDHINRIKTDNRLSNLRLLTNAQNSLNRNKTNGVTSKYRGVVKYRKGFRMVIQLKTENIEVYKYFSDEKEAAFAYNIYMKYHAPRELVLEHDLPGNVAGRFIPVLNVIK